MGGPIHVWQCEVPGCRREPKEHHGIELCASHWRKVSHEAFKALSDAMTGFGKKDGMPAWEAAASTVRTEARSEDAQVEQISLI